MRIITSAPLRESLSMASLVLKEVLLIGSKKHVATWMSTIGKYVTNIGVSTSYSELEAVEMID